MVVVTTKPLKLSLSDIYHFFDISDSRRVLPGVALQLKYTSVEDLEKILQMILYIISPLLPDSIIPEKLRINNATYKVAFATLLSRTKSIVVNNERVISSDDQDNNASSSSHNDKNESTATSDKSVPRPLFSVLNIPGSMSKKTKDSPQTKLNMLLQNSGSMFDCLSANVEYYVRFAKKILRIMALQWSDYQPHSIRKRYIKLCAKLEKIRQLSQKDDNTIDENVIVLYRDLLQTLVSFVMAMRKPYVGFVTILLLFVFLPIIVTANEYTIKSPLGLDTKLTSLDVFCNILFVNIRAFFINPASLVNGPSKKVKTSKSTHHDSNVNSSSGGGSSSSSSNNSNERLTFNNNEISLVDYENMNKNCDGFLLNYMATISSRLATLRRKKKGSTVATTAKRQQNDNSFIMNDSIRVRGTQSEIYNIFVQEMMRLDADSIMNILPIARFDNFNEAKIIKKFSSPDRENNIKAARGILHMHQMDDIATLYQKFENLGAGNAAILFPYAFATLVNTRDAQAIHFSGMYNFLSKRIKLRTIFDRIASIDNVEKFLMESFDMIATTRVFNMHFIFQILDLMRQHKIFMQDVTQFDGQVFDKILNSLGGPVAGDFMSNAATHTDNATNVNDSFDFPEDTV
ncbi:hypothetical protein DOLIC_00087 [Dolichomitus sp. PSUC_FEM 10030005]|nr:hypothetical protein [Dolichomitus sp. PSUC_FEM 10030005]